MATTAERLHRWFTRFIGVGVKPHAASPTGDAFPPGVREVVEAAPRGTILSDAEIADKAGLPRDAVETTFYLAYGSNLSSKVFTDRRGIRPLQAIPCTMRGWNLVFDLPALPWLEPSMANIRACDHAGDKSTSTSTSCDECVMHGVAYRVTKEQLRHLHSTEISYDLVLHPVQTYHSGETIDVNVLICNESVLLHSPVEEPLAPPSRRYMSILLAGAQEHQLHPDWVERLRTQPTAQPVSVWLKALAALVFAAPLAVLLLLDRVLWLALDKAKHKEFRWFIFTQAKDVLWSVWRRFHLPSASAPIPKVVDVDVSESKTS